MEPLASDAFSNLVCELPATLPAIAGGIAMHKIQTLSTPSRRILARHAGLDLDNDGRREFIVKRKAPLLNGTFEFYETTGDDAVELVHVLVASADNSATLIQSDVGDADGDGWAELTLFGQFSPATFVAQVYESLSPDSYPAKRVWNVTPGDSTRGVKIADTDGDGVQELVVAGEVAGGECRIRVYENDGDNSYSLTYDGDFSEITSAQSTIVADDLDGDGRKEILLAGLTTLKPKIFMVESTGDDTYETIWSLKRSYGDGLVANLKHLLDCGDLDGDGRKEFLVGGLGGGAPGQPYELVMFLFEAVGDSQFEVAHLFLTSYGPFTGGSSAAIADLDGDGKREIILASGFVMRIYRNTGDNAWEEIWTGPTGPDLDVIGAGDHDADGKEEIIFEGSGGGTEIWEIDPAYAADPDGDGLVDVIDNCPLLANPGQENADGDGAGDTCDCAPFDDTASALPGGVSGLESQGDKTSFNWISQTTTAGAGTSYDVVRGSLGGLPVGLSAETCLESGSLDATAEDATSPDPSAGFYYLVRGSNACGTGTYGTSSSGNERMTGACR